MSKQELKSLPIRFDPVNFADHKRQLHGLVKTKAMLRLLENVVSAESTAIADLKLSRGLYGYPLVEGVVEASVMMRCERCLDEVHIDLKAEISVLVKPENEAVPEKEGTKDADMPDFHGYDGKILVLSEMLEEELLLVLPLVPKHQDISLCNQDMVAWLAANEAPGDDPNEDSGDSAKRESPFAILKSVD